LGGRVADLKAPADDRSQRRRIRDAERTITAALFLERLQSYEFERELGPQAALALILLLPPVALATALRHEFVRGFPFGAIRARRGR
jgi:ABC-type glycerol-3-phosphate transport system permease component